MNLEIKYLSCYLPYQLKAIDEYGKQRIIDWFYQSYTNTMVGLNHVLFVGNLISIHKPILRPLSELVKEIEVNGKKFIPIEELRKTLASYDDVTFGGTYDNPTYQIDDDFNYVVNYENNKQGLCFSYDSDTKSFLLMINENECLVSNQYEMFEQLFEWHFDIFGLIDKGLAIDKNTLPC